MPACKGARLKIKRANEHISDIEARIDRLQNSLLCTAHVNPKTGNEFIKCDFASVSDRESLHDLPAVIGDAIHNLKCALDHVWLETMMRLVPATDWGRTKFPVHPTANDLELALRNPQISLHICAPNFFRFIMAEIKPYEGGDFAIRTVHELDIRDKHRLLIPVVHYSSIGYIYVKDENGEVHRGSTWGTTDPLPHYVEFVGGLHIENPGSASLAVMFEYGDTERETRTVDMLRFYSHHFLRVVELLENFTEGGWPTQPKPTVPHTHRIAVTPHIPT